MKVTICNQTDNNLEKELKELKKFVKYIIKQENLSECYFNVIIVDNEYIKNLNKTYRHIDKETDVITFALEDETSTKSKERVLGDIYISIEKAISQAKEYNHSLKRELSFLTIHGILHLLGYDHMNKDDEKIMFDKQEKYLEDFNITREQ